MLLNIVKNYRLFVGVFLFAMAFLFAIGGDVLAATICHCNDGPSPAVSRDAVMEAGGVTVACQGACAMYGGYSGVSDAAADSDDLLPMGEESNFDDLGIVPAGPSEVTMPNFSGAGDINELFLKILRFLMALAIPFAVVMIIWSGFLFVTAQGDQTKITAAKKNFLWTIAGLAIVLASEAIIGYVSELLGVGGGGGAAFIARIEDILREIIGLLFILVTIYFFWGIVEYVKAGSDDTKFKGKQHMLWGIIGMAVMAGAWGIVEIVASVVK